MFSSTAYEAFYTIIGLYMHESFVKLITSGVIFRGILILTFGVVFFCAVWGYFKKYLPSSFGGGKGTHLGTFVKIFASFLLGASILKVGAFSEAKNYKRISWHHNDYIETKIPNLKESYKVSFVFDIMTQSAEEVAKFLSTLVDRLFEKTNSELHAPSAFYKAILYAGSVSIDDPQLRSLIGLYSVRCFDEVIPLIEEGKRVNMLSKFFRPSRGVVDRKLKDISLNTQKGEITCYDLKEQVNLDLLRYSKRVQNKTLSYRDKISLKFSRNHTNEVISSLLNNYFTEKSETHWLNVQKGVKIPSDNVANFLIGMHRFFQFDGILSLFGGERFEGVGLSVARAMQFNEYLKRAPHIKGMVKLFLIAIFPWLIFFVFAGRWKILIAWWAIYASVLLWTPLWILLYHLMSSIALSTEVMTAFGTLNDGISLYSSELIVNRLYQFYAIYFWLQILIGPLPTVILAWGIFTGFLREGQEESAPEGLSSGVSVAGATVSGGPVAGVKTAAQKVAQKAG